MKGEELNVLKTENYSSCTGSALFGDLDPCPVFELSRYRSYVFSIENGKIGVYLENSMESMLWSQSEDKYEK